MTDSAPHPAKRLLWMNERQDRRPGSFTLFDREWDLLPGVFAPVYCFSTELFASWLPYPTGGSLLEMGSGTGVASVMAALGGCSRVTAVDISPAAVENTRRNAERHGVADRVTVLRSDLFTELHESDRYDVVFWNSNFVDSAEDAGRGSLLERAIFDPGYAVHRRFLRFAPAHLERGGRLLLGFGSLGNLGRLRELAAEAGFAVERLRSSGTRFVPGVEYLLLELVPAAISKGQR